MSLLQRSDHLQRVLDAVPDEVALLDAKGRIEFTNRAWQRFAIENGLKGDASSVGVNYLSTIQSGPDTKGVASALQAVLDGEKDGFRWTYPCHSPDQQHWFEMKVGRLSSGGAVVIHTEVTDRIVVEDAQRRLQFERHQRSLIQEERERLQDLLNEVSHKIATPLTPLLLGLDRLLKHDSLPADLHHDLQELQTQSKRITDALQGFRTHLDHALHGEAANESTQLQPWLQENQKMWQSMTQQRNVHLDVSAPDAHVAIPSTSLAFVVSTLLDECLRDAPLDGSIHFHIHVDRQRAQFELHATGFQSESLDVEALNEALAPHGGPLSLDQDTIQWSVALAKP